MNKEIIETLNFYNALGYLVSELTPEKESQEYAACRCMILGMPVILRQAKITPKKHGQFVTFWKRKDESSEIEPYTYLDEFSALIVVSKKGKQIGHFLFPKTVLAERKIITSLHHEGKRAFRVYPAWDKPESKQASATKKWQQPFFMNQSNETIQSKIEKAFASFSQK